MSPYNDEEYIKRLEKIKEKNKKAKEDLEKINNINKKDEDKKKS